MSNMPMRVFRARLTTVMDSVLKSALFEIMNIFENTLQDHQLELAHKGEEISQLQGKLQMLQIQLSECESGQKEGKDKDEPQMNESQPDFDNVNPAYEQTSDVPEIQFEVPDDWCAPLGCEITMNKVEAECPSVRLRKLYIPLCHVPLIKEEVDDFVIDSHKQKNMGQRKSKRLSKLKESDKDNCGRSTQPMVPAKRRVKRKDMKIFQQTMKQEYTDVTARSKRLRMKIRELMNTNVPTTEFTDQEAVKNSQKTFSCNFCTKAFDTPRGLIVHLRSHTQCKACGKRFSMRRSLVVHQRSCINFVNQDNDETPLTLGRKRVVTPGEKPTSSDSQNAARGSGNTSAPSIQKGKKHSCLICNKKFASPYQLEVHMRFHTDKRPYPCSMCTKKFPFSRSLRSHMRRRHKHHVDSSLRNGRHSWTMPLEIDDDQADLASPSTDMDQEVSPNKPDVEHKQDKEAHSQWEMMGTRCDTGFICSLCQEVLKSKYLLIKHYWTHTQEKPKENVSDHAKLGSPAQHSTREEKRAKPTKPLIPCSKCSKNFSTQAKLDLHLYRFHGNWPLVCKVCGKGFILYGCLLRHMRYTCVPEGQ